MDIIDKLVNVTISISEGAESSESFSGILLVGAAPEAEGASAKDVAVYESTDELILAGWTEEDSVYKAAEIAFSNGASEVYIAVQKAEDESVTDALDRAIGTSGWYGIALCDSDESEYSDVAEWAETNNKLFGYTTDCSEGIKNPVTGEHNYAFGFATRKIADNADNAYLVVAVFAKAMSYEAGSETWAYKTLSGMEADEFSSLEITQLKEAGLNYYIECAGTAITLDGKTTSGEWIDVIRFRDWLINDMQTRIFNLFIKNSKVPFTNNGITLIQNQMIASLKAGQSVGGIAETEYDDDGNELPGYTTSVPTAASVSDSDKESRTLTNCKFTARLANAIHIVEISGSLTV